MKYSATYNMGIIKYEPFALGCVEWFLCLDRHSEYQKTGYVKKLLSPEGGFFYTVKQNWIIAPSGDKMETSIILFGRVER